MMPFLSSNFLLLTNDALSDSKSPCKVAIWLGISRARCCNSLNRLFSSGMPLVWMVCESAFTLEVTLEKNEPPKKPEGDVGVDGALLLVSAAFNYTVRLLSWQKSALTCRYLSL